MDKAAVETAQSETHADDMPARVMRLVGVLRANYDTRPVSKAEWDAACGDEELAVATHCE